MDRVSVMGCSGLGVWVLKNICETMDQYVNISLSLLIRRVKQSKFLLPKWGADKGVLCLLMTFKFRVLGCCLVEYVIVTLGQAQLFHYIASIVMCPPLPWPQISSASRCYL